MNNAKMWLVVKPSVGVPLFLAGVGIASFAVHVAVVAQTNWYGDYVNGNKLGATAAIEAPASYAELTPSALLK